MEHLPNLLAIAGIWLAGVMTPGPNLLATVHFTLSRSRNHGLLVVLGLATGTTLWATASAFGLAALFARVEWLYLLLKLAGAGYLIFLGVRLMLSKGIGSVIHRASCESRPRGGITTFRVGILTSLSNPKTAVFFASLYASLMPLDPPLWLQLSSIAAIVTISISWYGTMAILFSDHRVARRYEAARLWIDRVTGGIFIGVGTAIAVER
ncbi:LysE family translocator [Magnetospira sp. QH-2]|uniref:LysE family translocator n=1 Tax=Magnetospira sp. (strain QH-2) TaxID=1288970 RepID=UPI0003E8124A|nr:LysE family translocator [Magnetospira sp. QH-2]CCQ73795.1 Putative Lysine exporter family protein (LYSE/YGGA), putative threonine efflux protein [Magnetospira sp. QH-2]